MKIKLNKSQSETLGLKENQEIEVIQEANVAKIIKDLANDFSGSNEDQMRGVQLIKGLATSDDAKANQFMKALDKATTEISNKMSEKMIESLGTLDFEYDKVMQGWKAEGKWNGKPYRAMLTYDYEGDIRRDEPFIISFPVKDHKLFNPQERDELEKFIQYEINLKKKKLLSKK